MPPDAPLKVSVVIPALDDAVMLAACLEALQAQTRPADEVIVVDNGSVDDTADVARRYGAIVVPEPRRGIFPATARGFDTATGDILARLDADSVPPPDWIERIAPAFDRNPSLAALTGPGTFYGSTPLVHWLAEHLYIGGYTWFCSMVLGHAPLFGSNLALRASAWERLRSTVHRDVREIHDDLDLAYHIEPDMDVVWDDTLRVGVSARPFASATGFWRRIRWAFGTLALNWQSPFARRAARRRARELRPTEAR
jgi:glycosyltransferase involved in cell wall biosynthesis